MKQSCYFAISCLLILNPQTLAFCATATGSLAVSANVGAICSVNSSSLAFGTYTSAVNNAVGNVNLLCTLSTNYSIALGVGQGSGASYTSRVLTGTTATNTLNYNLYTTAARTTVWGDGTGGSSVISGVGTGVPQAVSVYGTIPAGQLLAVDTYLDTVAINVTY